jgi:hypothetical protein
VYLTSRTLNEMTFSASRSLARQHVAQWRTCLSSGLFLDEIGWQDLRERVAKKETWENRRFREIRVLADRILSFPLPRYFPPEDWAGRITHFAALQELWQRPVGDSMVVLALAARLDIGSGYGERLREIVLAACEYPTWGRPSDGDNMDLSCGHLVRGIALAWSWLPELFDSRDREVIFHALKDRTQALLHGLYGQTYWSNRYQENHNHVNVAAMGIAGAAFLGEFPEAEEWLGAAILNFETVAARMNPDGSSAEGLPYWTYSLSYILQFIEALKAIPAVSSLYRAAFLRNALSFRIGSATSDKKSVVQWGDAELVDYYGPHHIFHRLSAEYNDAVGAAFAESLPFSPLADAEDWLAEAPEHYLKCPPLFRVPAGVDVAVWSLLWREKSIPAANSIVNDYHSPDWDMATTRSGWSDTDYVFSLKSGFTNRNHSHLDAGAISCCVGSEWLLPAPGYGNGQHDPEFWDVTGPRWTYFSNATESHATILIDGKNQLFSSEARGFTDCFVSTDRFCWIETDLSEAYEGSPVCRRRLLHVRGDYCLLLDDVEAFDATRIEWTVLLPPASEIYPRGASVRGRSGDLHIWNLDATANLDRRQILALRYDVEPSLTSCSFIQNGPEAHFAVLLAVRPAHSTLEISSQIYRSASGNTEIRICGQDYEDTIFLGNGLRDFSSSAGIEFSVEASSGFLRRRHGRIEHALFLGLSSIESACFQFQRQAPVCAEMTISSESNFTVKEIKPQTSTI